MTSKRLFFTAIVVATLAGCNSSTPPAGPGKAASSAPAPVKSASQAFQKGTPVAGEDFVAPGISLTVTPNPFSSCDFPKGQAVVNVGFDTRPAGIKHAQIWIQRTDGMQVLWGQAPGFSDPRPTGNWMSDGAKLLLVDLDTSNLVAVTTVHAAPCK